MAHGLEVTCLALASHRPGVHTAHPWSHPMGPPCPPCPRQPLSGKGSPASRSQRRPQSPTGLEDPHTGPVAATPPVLCPAPAEFLLCSFWHIPWLPFSSYWVVMSQLPEKVNAESTVFPSLPDDPLHAEQSPAHSKCSASSCQVNERVHLLHRTAFTSRHFHLHTSPVYRSFRSLPSPTFHLRK